MPSAAAVASAVEIAAAVPGETVAAAVVAAVAGRSAVDAASAPFPGDGAWSQTIMRSLEPHLATSFWLRLKFVAMNSCYPMQRHGPATLSKMLSSNML